MKKRPTAPPVRSKRTQRTQRTRKLSYDTLENKQMLAADLLSAPVQQTCALPEIHASSIAEFHRSSANVTDVIVGDGTGNRSIVESITVVFDGIVKPEANAFSMINRETGDRVLLEWEIVNSGGVSTVHIQFSGPLTTDGDSLIDGNYELTVHGDQLGGSSAASDFVFGDMQEDGLYRFYGDTDGDRRVGVNELLEFRRTWLQSAGDSAFDANFDSNGDMNINVRDLLEIRRNFNQSLEWTK